MNTAALTELANALVASGCVSADPGAPLDGLRIVPSEETGGDVMYEARWRKDGVYGCAFFEVSDEGYREVGDEVWGGANKCVARVAGRIKAHIEDALAGRRRIGDRLDVCLAGSREVTPTDRFEVVEIDRRAQTITLKHIRRLDSDGC